MNIELGIAWRYLCAHKSVNAIHIISGISAAAVGVVTAAMVIVLSVMNGFGVVVESLFSRFDPDLKIVPVKGKSFSSTSEQISSLYQLPCVNLVSSVVEETALARFEDKQSPVVMMGVDSAFSSLTRIDGIITDGHFQVWDGAFNRAVLGEGLAWNMGIGTHFVDAIRLYVPRREGRVNILRPDDSFKSDYCFIAGTFAVRQVAYDDRVMMVDIDMARNLLEYAPDEVTSLYVQVAPNTRMRQAKREIIAAIGPNYRVLDRYEQQEDFFHILRLEKSLTALLLMFILLIASFNIISSLSLLIMDKQQDIQILSHLGATQQNIQRIFLLEGWLISVLGAIGGLLLGLTLCLLQQHFGFIRLGSGQEYILSAYPIRVQLLDVLGVATIVLLLGALAAWIPARRIEISNT